MSKYLIINDPQGGAAVQLPIEEVGGVYVISGISVSGLGLTTAGVTDSADKRFVTNAELAALEGFTNLGTDSKLATVAAVDLNTAIPTSLYTVPALKTAIITRLVIRNASTSLTTVKFSAGFNSAAYDNVLADAARSELTVATLYSVLAAKTGATAGAAADVLKLKANTLQGAAATVSVDVYGYLV